MYRVRYGWMQHEDFGMFGDALAFYAKTPGAEAPMNLDRYDGSDDGNHSGLSEAEREAVELS